MINAPACGEAGIRNPLQLQRICLGLYQTTSRYLSLSLLLLLLPASLPPAAGGRLGRPGGDDLAVDGAQQQHEPDGTEHLGGRDAMSLVDGHVEEHRRHCGRAKVNSHVKPFKLSTEISNQA